MPTSNRQGHLMSADTLDAAAGIVAQQKAMEQGCLFLPHGCRLFRIEQGWESARIARDKGVRSCATLLSLEEALRDPEIKVIFIPLDALMTEKDIEKLCQRNGVAKTLFKEVGKP